MAKYYQIAFGLFCTMLALTNGQSIQDMELALKKTYEECIVETKITPDQIDSLGQFKVPTDRVPQCFLACIVKKVGLMDDDNKFSKDDMNEFMEPISEKLKEEKFEDKAIIITAIINKCIDEQTGDEDECVAATKAIECAVNNAKKEGLFD